MGEEAKIATEEAQPRQAEQAKREGMTQRRPD